VAERLRHMLQHAHRDDHITGRAVLDPTLANVIFARDEPGIYAQDTVQEFEAPTNAITGRSFMVGSFKGGALALAELSGSAHVT
jgi:hypothetical protein